MRLSGFDRDIHTLEKTSQMETQVRTPQTVFMHPQRLVVPLFQRPYVWNEENQWGDDDS